MDKDVVKGFFNWLESATDSELDVQREKIDAAYRRISTREGKADLNLARRLLDEEILARLSLKTRSVPEAQAGP